MKYVVTGGAGFIGSHLARKLKERGHEVIIVDDLSTGDQEKVVGYPFILGPASDVKRVRPDGIFHLGFPSSSPLYRENPSLVGKAVSEFVEVLECARREGARLIFASSSSLYNGNPLPYREDMPIQITDFYTEARYACERLAELWGDFHGVSWAGLRLFSVFGPGEAHKGRFANIISQMLLDGEFTIYGNGEQTRDFICVDDVTEAFSRAMEMDSNGIFNVGTGAETSFNEVAEVVRKYRRLEIEYAKNPIKNYVERTLADTSKAKKFLGWEPKIGLEEGVRKTLESLQNPSRGEEKWKSPSSPQMY